MPRTLNARRRFGLALLAGLAGGGLAGCGFELRQTPPLPFNRIALIGFAARSPLADELRERLVGTVQGVATAGQVRELQLRVKFEFRLNSPGGRELVGPTELMLSRDMSYSESFALAKGQEEAELYAAMQADIVQQVLRRLARADLAAPRAAGATAASTPMPARR